jgi:hypothetical protein
VGQRTQRFLYGLGGGEPAAFGGRDAACGFHLLRALLDLDGLGCPVSGGGTLVSVAWEVLSVVLLAGPALLLPTSSRKIGAAGLIYWSSKAGYVVLALVVAKLFLYDLAAVEPILHILLFCGFGAAFLLATYLFGGDRDRARFNSGLHRY